MSKEDLIKDKQLEINFVKHLLTRYPGDKDLLLHLNQLNLELQGLERPGKIERLLEI